MSRVMSLLAAPLVLSTATVAQTSDGVAVILVAENEYTIPILCDDAARPEMGFSTEPSRRTRMAPMDYLLAWRMAVAKDLLRGTDLGVTEVARRVGYGSASTFSTAFSRHVGKAPSRYARRGKRAAA